MNLLNDDLKIINFQFLMLVRECARHSPMEAIWKFNLKEVDIEKLSSMSLDEIKDLANCGRAVFTVLPLNKARHYPTHRGCIIAGTEPSLKGD